MLSVPATCAICHILTIFSFIFDSLLVILYFLSLGLKGPDTQSGGIFEASSVILVGIACTVFVAYGFCQFDRHLNYQGRAKVNKRALLIAFSSAFLLMSAASIIITIRASQDGGNRLCADFSATRFPCTTGFAIVVLSWLSTLISFVGFIVCYIGSRAIAVTSTRPEPMGLDPISSRPATIESFLQMSGDPPPPIPFWTIHAGIGRFQPKDLFQQSLPRSVGIPYRQRRGVPV